MKATRSAITRTTIATSHSRARAALGVELAAADAAIERATGRIPTLARPPYGGRSPLNVRVFDRLAKRVVLWDINSYDWKGAPAPDVAQRILERARPGSIILMHDGGRPQHETIETVRMLVPELRARGYDFATVTGALT